MFDRKLDAATATAARFTLDNGLTVSAASVDDDMVTLTTSAITQGVTYTVTVSPQVTDRLGTGVATPNTATFQYLQLAVLSLNEINPNVASSRDLIELLALTSGNVLGLTVVQRGNANETLVTLPDLLVAAGDLLVVHMSPSGAPGVAAASETVSKNQHPAATFSANYDGAWDILGGATGLTFGNRVIEVRAPGAAVAQDVVPVVVSNAASPLGAFPGLLRGLQTASMWFPANCGGAPCTYLTTPTAVEISVDYLGCGTTATGNSIARNIGGFSSIKADWDAAAAHSWGLPNP